MSQIHFFLYVGYGHPEVVLVAQGLADVPVAPGLGPVLCVGEGEVFVVVFVLVFGGVVSDCHLEAEFVPDPLEELVLLRVFGGERAEDVHSIFIGLPKYTHYIYKLVD